MLRRVGLLVMLGGILSVNPTATLGQAPLTLTQAYPDSVCGSCAGWNEDQAPFRLHHQSWYVGTRGLSAILITSTDGHILLDGGLPDSAPKILASIRQLGLEPSDVRLILTSHVHYDHVGGVAALQQVTGARVAANPTSALVLEQGRGGSDDPQFGLLLDFPPVAHVERFLPGDTLRVGKLELVSHATAGHAPGGTSWSWRSCDDAGDCLDLVYADSQTPVAAEGFRFSESPTYPAALMDFEAGFRALEGVACDILVTTHPTASGLWERLESGSLVDPEACRNYAAAARRGLGRRLAAEALDGH